MPLTRRDERGLSAPATLGVMGVGALVMGLIISLMTLPIIGGLAFGSRTLTETIENLPADLETLPLAQRTQIVDRNGTVIATLYDENRVEVPLRQVSRTMVKAIVAIEDYRFYQHGALDMKGTLRALLTNQAGGGEVVQGGSSITQQMVKLTLLSQAKTKEDRVKATEDTYGRKIRELRYAIAFEKAHSKDWILERYLNIAYFGDGAYGVQSAARHYFNKNAKDLALHEAAMIAGLVKNPTKYDPTNNPDTAIARRNVVIERMRELNVITDAKAEKTKAMPLRLKVVEQSNGCVFSRAPFFCDYTVRTLLRDKSLGETVKARKKYLFTAGLTIHTTLDMRFQAAADASVRSHVFPLERAIGGLAMVEPGTGEVRALAQSRPFGFKKRKGETSINYTIPKSVGNAPGFQAGSTFKVFVLTAAIMQGTPLRRAIKSPGRRTFELSKFLNCKNQPYDYGPYEVGNFDGRGGLYDLYTGTRNSVNTFFIALTEQTGICQPFKLAKAMGVELTQPNGDKNGRGPEMIASFPLGVVDASPLEVAEAYATFGARGLHCESRPVLRIEDTDGDLVKRYRPECEQVFEQPVADAVNDILRGVIEGGFASRQRLAIPAAGKTGTTQDQKAVWFAGYTPQLATASMVAGVIGLKDTRLVNGRRQPEGSPAPLKGQYVGGQYVSSASGSAYAAPMWGDAMRAVVQFLTWEDFVRPPSSFFIGATDVIPDVVGFDVQVAKGVLEAQGFTVEIADPVKSDLPKNAVVSSSPAGGSEVATGTLITLVPSGGKKYKPEPDPVIVDPTTGLPTTGPGNGNGNGNGND